MAKLTDKQKRFVQEYLVDLNATQAAARAGYSARTANEQGARLLAKDSVRQAVRQGQERISRKLEITRERVLREYARLAFFDPRRLFEQDGRPRDINQLDEDTAAALAGLDVLETYEGTGEDRRLAGCTKKYKLANKLGALDSLGKHLGLFNTGAAAAVPENNLLEALEARAGEELDTAEIAELETPGDRLGVEVPEACAGEELDTGGAMTRRRVPERS